MSNNKITTYIQVVYGKPDGSTDTDYVHDVISWKVEDNRLQVLYDKGYAVFSMANVIYFKVLKREEK